MDTSYLITLGFTGFTVAFLHAAIPTHWLPFVMVGRARGWSPARTLAAVALAGGLGLARVAVARCSSFPAADSSPRVPAHHG